LTPDSLKSCYKILLKILKKMPETKLSEQKKKLDVVGAALDVAVISSLARDMYNLSSAAISRGIFDVSGIYSAATVAQISKYVPANIAELSKKFESFKPMVSAMESAKNSMSEYSDVAKIIACCAKMAIILGKPIGPQDGLLFLGLCKDFATTSNKILKKAGIVTPAEVAEVLSDAFGNPVQNIVDAATDAASFGRVFKSMREVFNAVKALGSGNGVLDSAANVGKVKITKADLEQEGGEFVKRAKEVIKPISAEPLKKENQIVANL